MSQSSAGLDTPEPDLAASLSSLAASFASQYSPLEFIVKALVTRLHHVENVVGIGPGAPKGAVTLESRIADMEKEMKTLAHNVSLDRFAACLWNAARSRWCHRHGGLSASDARCKR